MAKRKSVFFNDFEEKFNLGVMFLKYFVAYIDEG